VEEVAPGDRLTIDRVHFEVTEATHSGRREPFGPEGPATGCVVAGSRSVLPRDTDLFPAKAPWPGAWSGPAARVGGTDDRELHWTRARRCRGGGPSPAPGDPHPLLAPSTRPACGGRAAPFDQPASLRRRGGPHAPTSGRVLEPASRCSCRAHSVPRGRGLRPGITNPAGRGGSAGGEERTGYMTARARRSPARSGNYEQQDEGREDADVVDPSRYWVCATSRVSFRVQPKRWLFSVRSIPTMTPPPASPRRQPRAGHERPPPDRRMTMPAPARGSPTARPGSRPRLPAPSRRTTAADQRGSPPHDSCQRATGPRVRQRIAETNTRSSGPPSRSTPASAARAVAATPGRGPDASQARDHRPTSARTPTTGWPASSPRRSPCPRRSRPPRGARAPPTPRPARARLDRAAPREPRTGDGRRGALTTPPMPSPNSVETSGTPVRAISAAVTSSTRSRGSRHRRRPPRPPSRRWRNPAWA